MWLVQKANSFALLFFNTLFMIHNENKEACEILQMISWRNDNKSLYDL